MLELLETSALDVEDDIETAGGVTHRGDMLQLFESSALDAEDDIETAGGVTHRGEMVGLFEKSSQWIEFFIKVE